LRRVRDPSGKATQHLKLWRGSNQFEEQLLTGSLQTRHCTVRLNNVVSFSLSEEDASCFGDWVMEVQVPVCKVLVFPDLLPGQVLQGEQEVLALGGDYEVTARYA
jgi:NAD+--dinitrogen-reductase ADP-D-ribosyltransferase